MLVDAPAGGRAVKAATVARNAAATEILIIAKEGKDTSKDQ